MRSPTLYTCRRISFPSVLAAAHHIPNNRGAWNEKVALRLLAILPLSWRDGVGSRCGKPLSTTSAPCRSRIRLTTISQFFAISESSSGGLDLNTSMGLGIQFTWTETRDYKSYAALKKEARHLGAVSKLDYRSSLLSRRNSGRGDTYRAERKFC